jgi:hypothetical protein
MNRRDILKTGILAAAAIKAGSLSLSGPSQVTGLQAALTLQLNHKGKPLLTTFSISGLPAGTTATFTPSTCKGDCQTILRLATTPSAVSGNYSLLVRAQNAKDVATMAILWGFNASEPVELVPDFFVSSSDGNDSDNGLTEGTAWATCAKVNAQSFSPGDVIAFKRGDTWTEDPLRPPSSGSAGNPIIFGAYGVGNKPKFDANNSTTFADFAFGIVWISGKHHITLQDIEIINGARDLITVTPGPGGSPPGSNNITIRRCSLDTTGADWSMISVVNFQEGTGGTSLAEGLTHDILIEENTVANSGWNGVRVNGGVTDCQILDNIIHDCAHNGIDVKQSRDGLGERNKRFTITGNQCYLNDTGIFTDSIADSTIDGNIMHDNTGAAGEGYKVHGFTMTNLNLVIQRNIAYGNEVGFFIDSTIDSEFYNNTGYGNGLGVFQSNNTGLDDENNLYYANTSPPNEASNPLFVNPGAGDFRLGGGSPAIDAGVDVGLPFNGSAPDLGALET